jgi:hypothetical protein
MHRDEQGLEKNTEINCKTFPDFVQHPGLLPTYNYFSNLQFLRYL